jgi:DNA invertase Pin-like site-specific DNA recombinase
MNKLKCAACYLRVSTDLQDTRAQETELKQYAQSSGCVAPDRLIKDYGVQV